MKSFTYGNNVVGWIPGTMAAGGRYVFFKTQEEYEAVYRRVTVDQRKKNLEKLIADAGIRGGKERYTLAYRSRG